MKKLKIFSVFLSIVLCLTAMPLTGLTSFAATSGDFEYEILSETDKTCEIKKYNGNATDLTIPSTIDGYAVTSIGESSFEECPSLTSITIPNSVKKIGWFAFSGCSSLISVTIPNSVLYIGDFAFGGIVSCCSSLKSIEVSSENPNYSSENGVLFNKKKTELIRYPAKKQDSTYIVPNSVTDIYDSAFAGCTSLTSVILPDNVDYIEDNAFYDCTSLENITIPDTVKGISSLAFYDTAYYNNPTNWENDVLYIGNHLIEACDSIEGKYIVKNGTVSIAHRAFYRANLTHIEIPDSVINVGSEAFSFCKFLKSVKLGNGIKDLFWQTFGYCTALENIIIPNSVTNIGPFVFSGCTSLVNIIIPDSVTNIDLSAFEGCSSLTSVTIPNSVTGIGDSAFKNTAYYNDAANWKNDVLYIGNHLIEAKDTLSGAYSICSGTISIADRAFASCTELTSVTMSNNVTSIGKSAFEECRSLTSVTIPNSVTNIGEYAFWNCALLTSVTIPKSVTSIGKKALGLIMSSNGFPVLISGFTIYGYAGTEAQRYAEAHNCPFVALASYKDKATDIQVYTNEQTDSAFAQNTVLNSSVKETSDTKTVYDIFFTQNGGLIQPNTPVTVKIPVPASMSGEDCKVYRQEADGTYTDMNAFYQNGYMVFTTDHFSVYVLTTESLGVTLGDINSDGTVDDWDSVLLDRYLAGWDVQVDASVADIDQNGVVDDWDGVLLSRNLAGWKS